MVDRRPSGSVRDSGHSASAPTSLRMRPPRQLSDSEQRQMAVDHMRAKKLSAASAIERLLPVKPPFRVPTLISAAPDRRHKPFSVTFPIPTAAQKQLATSLPSVLDPVPGRELWVIYQNDGRGINPGAGSDQGPTAALKFFFRWRNSLGLVLGATIIDMETPAPGPVLPAGTKGRRSTYTTAEEGPYVGTRAMHIGFTVYRGGGWRIDSLTSVGQDSARWGEAIQDAIHDLPFVDSPHFDWQKRADRLFAEQEFTVRRQAAPRATSASFQARIEPFGALRGGTRRAEAEFGAKVVLEKATVFAGRTIYLESSVGGVGRGFLRYNDGRSDTERGVEGGFIGGLAASMGRVTVRIDYEDIQSSDPSRRTPNNANNLALGQQKSPIFGTTGRGGHRRGTVSFVYAF